MTDEQDGGGYGIVTIVAIVLLFVALIGFAWFYFGESGLINKTKEATKKFLPDTKELERIKEDVFNADELKIKKEEEAKDEIFAFFEDAFNKARTKTGECVHEIDFSGLKDKDFELEFSETSKGTNIKIVRGSRDNQIRVYNKEYSHLVCFYDKGYKIDDNKKNYFWLINEFQNIFIDGKEKDLIIEGIFAKPILYRTQGRVCFVGKDALPEVNIYKKNSCELSDQISELEKIGPSYRDFMANKVDLSADKTFVTKKIELMRLYYQDKKFWNVLNYYIFFDKILLDDSRKDEIGVYRELAIDKLEDNKGEWVLCKVGNKHACVVNDNQWDPKNLEGTEVLPVPFNFLQECEKERAERVDIAEAALYVLE